MISLEKFLNVKKNWKHGPKKTKYVGLFQKLIYCPYDKHNFTLEAHKFKKGIRFYYWCMPIRKDEKTCNRRFLEKFIENLVLHSIKKSNLFTIYKKKTEKKQVDVKKEVEKIDKKIERYINLLEYRDIPIAQVRAKLKELQEKKKETLKSVRPAQDKEILQYLKTIEEVHPYMGKEERQRLWRITIKRITLYKDRFQIMWNNSIKTQGLFQSISIFGAEGGSYVRNIEIEKRINNLFFNLVESLK